MSQAIDAVSKGEKKIGEILLANGAIKEHHLQHALEIQNSEKGHLGKILVGENYVRNFELYQAVAERFGLRFVNLLEYPPNPKLLNSDERHNYFALQALPYQESGAAMVIAATNITEDLKNWAAQTYPEREINFVITSPYDISFTIQKNFTSENNEEALLKLSRHNPLYSAHLLFRSFRSNIIAAAFVAAFIAATCWQVTFLPLLALMNFLFLSAVSFKNILFVKGWGRGEEPQNLPKDLPVYTILLPLYRETKTLPKLIKAMQNLDYPKTKLDIKFVVEADDLITIDALKRERPPQYMEIVAVPFSLPRTKPKACNYALHFARGELTTIYDAEDVPEPSQLKRVLARFNDPRQEIACVQARLNYDNYRDNILTRWFALEYGIWFDSIINGLARLKMPVFLGGTSNYIRTETLRKIGGWDAFNVTEDADLGMRLAQEGYVTATVNSLTLEEAPNGIRSWTKQRTRWLKGFLQTYFVHMRQMRKLIENTGWRGFASLQLLIGIPILIYIASPLLLTVTLVSGAHSQLPDWLMTACWLNLFYGMASHVVMCLLAAGKAKDAADQKLFKSSMVVSSLTFYLYGILHIIAAFRAIYQLVTAPHYWDKTEHGLAKTGS